MSKGREDSAAAVIAAAMSCDLRVLDDPEVWGDIDPRPKDFIRRLLVLDERARLTADQALMHGWFTQESDGQPILARYEQAVDGWRPSWPGRDFMEHLSAFIDTRIPDRDVLPLWSGHCEHLTDPVAATKMLQIRRDHCS